MAIHILNFSGGKDSTATLSLLLEQGEPLDACIFCDTGAEFDELYCHLYRVEAEILRPARIPLYWLTPRRSLPFVLTGYKRVRGRFKGAPYGWPTPRRRWCTMEYKVKPRLNFLKRKYPSGTEFVIYTGYALQEVRRSQKQRKYRTSGMRFRFPLIEYGLTSEDALKLCYERGFSWGGLYERFKRLSCWMCPFKTPTEREVLRKEFPEYWEWICATENFHRELGLPNWRWRGEEKREEGSHPRRPAAFGVNPRKPQSSAQRNLLESK